MENIKVGSVEQATMVVGVLAMATDNDDGISGDSQVKTAMYLLTNLLCSCSEIFILIQAVYVQKVDHSTALACFG